MIAVGIVIEPSTVTGAIRLGITSMNMIRMLPAPSDRAASMNSRSLICSTWPRTIRPMDANEKKVMTKIVNGVLGPEGRREREANSRYGNDSVDVHDARQDRVDRRRRSSRRSRR